MLVGNFEKDPNEVQRSYFVGVDRNLFKSLEVHGRNVRGLGKSVVVFRLFEKLRHSDERATKFESPKQD